MAIRAEWQRDSESAPGFNKYFITIRETDGTEVKVPAYGRDMQDALSRLVKTERAEKFVETTERIPDYVYILLFLGTLGVGATLSTAARPVGYPCWEWLDIASGIPMLGTESVDQLLPQFIDLDTLGAISFSKGCYPGQEVVARLHYRGTVKRRLARAHVDG